MCTQAPDASGLRVQVTAGCVGDVLVCGDSTGANLRSASYGANSLNQHTNRTAPNAADIIGIANAVATATVNGQTTYRRGEYYQKALPIDNSVTNVYQSVTNNAVLSGSTNSTIGNVFLPRTPEINPRTE